MQVDIVKQLEYCKESFSWDFSTLVTSLENNKLFKVREYVKQLSEEKGEFFHLVMANVIISYEQG